MSLAGAVQWREKTERRIDLLPSYLPGARFVLGKVEEGRGSRGFLDAWWLLGIDGEGRGSGGVEQEVRKRWEWCWQEKRAGCSSGSYFKRGEDNNSWRFYTVGPWG
nr:hypothetical protein [Tanacetum cinerariifolium]